VFLRVDRVSGLGWALLLSVPAVRPLAAQKLDLADLGHDRGNPEAPIAVVEFADFGCDACADFARDTWPGLLREAVDSGTVVWKLIPVALGPPGGADGARAAECAGRQNENAFWGMHDLLFGNQDAWRGADDREAYFERYADRLGLSDAAFRSCWEEDGEDEAIDRGNAAAAVLGIHAVPTFFVNGYRLDGAVTLKAFRRVLERVGGG